MVAPKRVNRKEPCKICGHDSWCFTYDDGAHGCMREHADVVAGKWYKQHSKLNSAGVQQTIYRDQPRPQKAARKAEYRKFDYYTLDGKPVVRVHRKDFSDGRKKEIWQQRKNPKSGRWVKGGIESDRRSQVGLYRSPEIQKAIANGETIFVAEGETAADAIVSLGLQSTTNLGGTGAFHESDWEQLKGASVVLCPDTDGNSIKFFRKIAQLLPNSQWLYVYPQSFVWHNLFSDGGGVDAVDYIAEKKPTVEEFLSLIIPQERKDIRILELPKVGEDKPQKEEVADDVVKAIAELVDQDLSGSEVTAALRDIRTQYNLQVSEAKEIYRDLAWKKETGESLLSNRSANRTLIEDSNTNLSLSYIFGESLGSQLEVLAEDLRIDPNRVVTPLLTTVGKCVGGKIPLFIKRNKTEGGWKQYPIIFGVDVAPPGWGKSTLMDEILAPIRKRQELENERYKKALEELTAVKERWGLMGKDEQREKLETDENPRIYAKEHCQFVFDLLQETTTEGLFRRMSEQAPGHGLLLESDEISGLFKSFSQYSKNGNNSEQLFLGLWNKPSYTGFNRANLADSYHASGQTLSVYGGIQPGLFSKAFEVEKDSNGLASRFLFTVAKLPENFDQFSEKQPEVRNTLDELYGTLSKLPKFEVDFSPAAKELFKARFSYHKRKIREHEDTNTGLSSYYAKGDNAVARIALILHLIDCSFNDGRSTWETLEAETLQRAIYLYDFYVNQFKLLQLLNSTAKENELDKMLMVALKRLRKYGQLEVGNFARIYNRRGNSYEGDRINKSTTRKIFRELADMDYGILSGDLLILKGGESTPPTSPTPPTPPTTPINDDGNSKVTPFKSTQPSTSSNGKAPQITKSNITDFPSTPAPVVGNLAVKPLPEPMAKPMAKPVKFTTMSRPISEYTSDDEPIETVIFNGEPPSEPRKSEPRKSEPRKQQPKGKYKSKKKYSKTPAQLALESPPVPEEQSPWKDSYHGITGLFSVQRGEDVYNVEWNPQLEEFATELLVKKAFSAVKITITIQDGDRFYYPHRVFGEDQ